MSRRRVVVTGLGVVSPLGCDPDRYIERLLKGQSGIRRITQFDASAFDSQIAGEVVEFEVDRFISKKEQRRMDPFSQYGMAASKMAVVDSGVDMKTGDATRRGVLIGTGIGGLQICEDQTRVLIERGPSRFSPFMIPQMITNISSGQVAIEFGLQGPSFCTTSACASSTNAIGEALRMIQYGEVDLMLAGGTEGAVCQLAVGGFAAMRALSTRNDAPEKASRPFDRDRDGFVMAEGSGMLILEDLDHAKKRGARIYCELTGYGRTCDAYHITAPHEEGDGAARAMKLAMQDAGLNPEQITYINGHATSTGLGDIGETKAIKRALGEAVARKVMISATKSMIGHGLGAAGALESVACIKMMQRGAVHPTINLDNPDPACDLDYVPHTARQVDIKACLNNSFGFGGHNATLCFTAFG